MFGFLKRKSEKVNRVKRGRPRGTKKFNNPVKTSLCLEGNELDEFHSLAKQRGVTSSELMRRMIHNELKAIKTKKR